MNALHLKFLHWVRPFVRPSQPIRLLSWLSMSPVLIYGAVASKEFSWKKKKSMMTEVTRLKAARGPGSNATPSPFFAPRSRKKRKAWEKKERQKERKKERKKKGEIKREKGKKKCFCDSIRSHARERRKAVESRRFFFFLFVTAFPLSFSRHFFAFPSFFHQP